MSATTKFSGGTGTPASRRSIVSCPACVIASATGSLKQLLGTDFAKRRALLQLRRQIGEHPMESLDLGGKGRQRFGAVAATDE